MENKSIAWLAAGLFAVAGIGLYVTGCANPSTHPNVDSVSGLPLPELQSSGPIAPFVEPPIAAAPLEEPRPKSFPKKKPAVRFATNSAKIEASSLFFLRTQAQKLKTNRRLQVKIEGHADERGTIAYNKSLGFKRAQSVQKYLVKNGARQKQLKIVSYGKARPRVSGHDEIAWSVNRRAELKPLKVAQQKPKALQISKR